ncbi:MAG: hypothetical protein ACTSPU_04540, partial [Promethearchaeota archaeon]
MSFQNILYKIKAKIKLQFVKQTWLNIKRDRAKALFAIGGIAVSIILLTAIGMVNDSMSYNYMGMITRTTGSSDIIISKASKSDLSFNPFFDETIIENKLHDIPGVEELFPRIMMLAKVSSDFINSTGTLQIYGIDFNKEANNGHMGNLNLVNGDGKETGEIYNGEPRIGECVILWIVADLLNVSLGDEVHLEYINNTLDVKVVAICK